MSVASNLPQVLQFPIPPLNQFLRVKGPAGALREISKRSLWAGNSFTLEWSSQLFHCNHDEYPPTFQILLQFADPATTRAARLTVPNLIGVTTELTDVVYSLTVEAMENAPKRFKAAVTPLLRMAATLQSLDDVLLTNGISDPDRLLDLFEGQLQGLKAHALRQEQVLQTTEGLCSELQVELDEITRQANVYAHVDTDKKDAVDVVEDEIDKLRDALNQLEMLGETTPDRIRQESLLRAITLLKENQHLDQRMSLASGNREAQRVVSSAIQSAYSKP